MVDTLVGKTCTPCKGGIPPLTPEEAEAPSCASSAVGCARRGPAASSALSGFRTFARR